MTFTEIQEALQKERLELLKLSKLGAGAASIDDVLNLYEFIGELLAVLELSAG